MFKRDTKINSNGTITKVLPKFQIHLVRVKNRKRVEKAINKPLPESLSRVNPIWEINFVLKLYFVSYFN